MRKVFGRNCTVAGPLMFIVLALAPSQAQQSATQHNLSSRPSVLLGDFADRTGGHLENALRQALWAALDQSPYLDLEQEVSISAALRKAGYPADARVTSNLAQDVCRLAGARDYVSGSLDNSRQGSGFVLQLEAIDCSAGDSVAYEQAAVPDKKVLVDALGRAAAKLRADLGEPAEELQGFNPPLSQAISSSFDALNAWSAGMSSWRANGATAAIASLTKAIQLDPNFAAATYDLGLAYRNAGEEGRARDLFTKAFLLREQTTARKRFAITAQYYSFVTVEIDPAVSTFKEWIRTYPSDAKAVSNLGSLYGDVCRYQEAIAQFEQARRMDPDNVIPYEDLMEMLLAAGDFDRVRTVNQEIRRRGLDDDAPHLYMYVIGFLQSRPQEMADAAAWFAGKADLKHEILSEQADAAAYAGHLAEARKLSDAAVESALKADNREQAAGWLLNSAWREALFGDPKSAHEQAERALQIAPGGREGAATAAIVLARMGDTAAAERLVRDLEKRYPNHFVMQSYWLPCIRAQIALKQGDAAGALKELQTAAPLDLLYPQIFFYSHMPSVVLRAEAYSLAGRPEFAAKEWQKVIDHPGIVQLSATAPFAKLQLARAEKAQTPSPASNE